MRRKSEKEEQRVIEANRRFYSAMESLDLEQMDSVWLHDEWVKCIHPGWELIEGWEEIRRSWMAIFANTAMMRISPSSVSVKVDRNLAVVFCIENIIASAGGEFNSARALATNVFILSDDNWLMVHHHASPLPVHLQPGESGTVQ